MYRPYYQRPTRFNGNYRSYGPNFRTRYLSTRPTPGIYRRPSRYVVTGAARRRYGRARVLSIMRSVAEHKNHDVVFRKDGSDASATPYVTANGVIMDVSTIFQGSADSSRVGDKCTLTSIEFRHQCYPNLNIAQWELYSYRITIFIWKDDTTPTLTDIYDTTGGFTGTATYLTSLYPFNHDLKVKRKVLYDKSFTSVCEIVNNTQIGNSEGGHQFQNIVIPMTKLKNKLNEINFISSTSNGVNKVYVLLSNNLAPTIVPSVSLPFNHFISCRLNYTDV